MTYIQTMLDMTYYLLTNITDTPICEYFLYLFILALVFKWVRVAITW